MINILRKTLFHLKKVSFRLVQNKIWSLTIGPIVGAYYLTLDVWGDKWEIVQKYENIHSKVFIVLLFFSLIAWILRSLIKDREDKDLAGSISLLTNFIEHIGRIVDTKTNRFEKLLPELTTTRDKFKHITMPNEQINEISKEIKGFCRSTFELQEDEIDFTVIQFSNNEIKFVNKMQKWNHPGIEKMLVEKSAGSTALETGEAKFFPCKFSAAKKKEFHLSNRDIKRKCGSAYIHPVSIKVSDSLKVDFVVSIVTYGKKICDEWDEASIKITCEFLKEFCRRVELELYLYVLKMLHEKELES